LKSALRTKLDSLAKRLEELNRLLSAENAARDMDEFRKLSREHAELSRVIELYGRYQQAERDAADAAGMASDPAMKGFAEEEIKAAQGKMVRLEAEVQAALLPRDPNDDRNLFLEVRAGTGGDESALFAGDLFRMYTRYA
jgi:peptide chain release factor 1